MNELEQLKAIFQRLESIGKGSPAAVTADLSEWLYKDAPNVLPLIDSAMQYTAEILEYNAEMDKHSVPALRAG